VLESYPFKTISKIDELKSALFAVKNETGPTDRAKSSKTSPEVDLKKFSNKPKTSKKVKPIYSWEKGGETLQTKTDDNEAELPHHLDNSSFSEQMRRVGKIIEEQIQASSPNRSSSPIISPRRTFGKKKETKGSVQAPLTPRSLQLEIQMDENDLEKLAQRRSVHGSLLRERPRSSSPNSMRNNASDLKSKLSLNLSALNRSDSISSYSDLKSKNFLQKGKGRLASDGNPFLKMYTQPALLYNTSYLLSGLSDLSSNNIMDQLENVQKDRIEAAINDKSPGFSVADVEGLYITTVGPYQDPKVDVFRPSNKTKWVDKKGFIPITGKRQEFSRDKNLPNFINTGLPYESSNPHIVQQKLRSDDKDKMMSPRPFISSFGRSGCDCVDKQYSFGVYSPSRGSLTSFTAPSPPPVRASSPVRSSPILVRKTSRQNSIVNSAAINVISKGMVSPKCSPRGLSHNIH